MIKAGKILLYTKDKEKLNRIREITEGLKLSLQLLSPSARDLTLAEILGLSPKNNEKTHVNPLLSDLPECMIFSGLSDDELDRFLKLYRLSGLPRIPLKAVVTVHNVRWTLTELLKELEKERKAMEQRSQD